MKPIFPALIFTSLLLTAGCATSRQSSLLEPASDSSLALLQEAVQAFVVGAAVAAGEGAAAAISQ